MLEAVWSVKFRTQNDSGAGVVVLDSGKVYGGDSQYLYVGNYRAKNDPPIVEATILVRKYNTIPGFASVFGALDKFTLSLSGPIARQAITLQGHLIDPATGQTMVLDLTRQEELP